MCHESCAVLVPIPTFLEPYVYFNPEHPEFGIDEQGRRCLAIDACMVDALRALWDREIPTISACCLHGAGEGVITLPRVVEPGTEPPKPNWLQRDEALDRLAASEQEAARLRAALRFYAEIREYNPPGGSPPDEAAPIMGDRGMRARRALGLPEWDGTLPEALAATTAPEAERAGPDGGAG
jgi:hypothetical protein